MKFRDSVIAYAFLLSIFGFYSFAPLIGLVVPPDDPRLSIALRGLTLGLVILGLIWIPSRLTSNLILQSAPLFLLLIFYFFRLYDNYFLQNISVYVPAAKSIGFLLGAALFPALLALRIGYGGQINDRLYGKTTNILLFIFLFGIISNYEILLANTTGRLSLDRINPIALGSMAVNYLLFLAIFSRHSRSYKLLALALVPILIAVALLANSRGPLVSVLIALIFYACVSTQTYRKLIFNGVILGTFAIIVGELIFDTGAVDIVLKRFSAIMTGDASVSGRILAWQRSISDFGDNPILGKYIFDSATLFYPHNIFLESLISLGMLGGILFVWITIITFRSCTIIASNPSSNLTSIFISLLFVKEFIGGMFSGSIWSVTTLWICGAYTIGYRLYLAAPKKSKRRNYSNNPLMLKKLGYRG